MSKISLERCHTALDAFLANCKCPYSKAELIAAGNAAWEFCSVMKQTNLSIGDAILASKRVSPRTYDSVDKILEQFTLASDELLGTVASELLSKAYATLKSPKLEWLMNDEGRVDGGEALAILRIVKTNSSSIARRVTLEKHRKAVVGFESLLLNLSNKDEAISA